jgi:serine/threonine-protein kinase RsbW
MPSPSSPDAVIVSVPASPSYVNLFRAVTASVASRVPLSFDAIEDLKLAVDEGCARLLAVSRAATRMQLRLKPSPDGLEATVSIDAQAGPWPPPNIEETFSWRVLSALVDTVALDLDGGAPAVKMTKARLEPQVSSEAP